MAKKNNLAEEKKKDKLGKRKYSKLAVASFVLGIFAPIFLILFGGILSGPVDAAPTILENNFVILILSLFTFSSFVAPVPSFVFGIMALLRIKKNKTLKGKSLAIAGIIISGLFLLSYIFGAIIGWKID